MLKMFQFLKGSIKVENLNLANGKVLMFQFLKGSIKVFNNIASSS